MMFGKPQPAPPLQGDVSHGVVFDVTTAEFEQRVILASMRQPVIVDFWAPWCGPCKQLGPMLEKAVQAAGGKILMAKVNIDQNQELAAALRIQSIPTVFAFFQGRPVDAFQGALPESQIKAFVDKLLAITRQAMPDALDIPAALKAAAEALAAGDPATAQNIYASVLEQDEKSAAAYAGLVRTFLAAGQLDQAAAMVQHAPEEIAAQTVFSEAKTALELAQNKPSGSAGALSAKLAADPNDHQARFDLAQIDFAEGRREQAVENLLEILRRNRMWNEETARHQLLKFFEAMGPADPLTVQSRRQLSTILFS